MKTSHPASSFVLAALFCVSSLSPVLAANQTWNGGGTDNLWNTAANWGGASLAASDSLFFSGTTRLATVNPYTAGTSFLGITFTQDAGAFVLGGNSVTLEGNVTNESGNKQTIDLAMVLVGNRTFTVHGGELLVKGNLSESTSAVLVKGGLGTLTLAGANTYTGDTRINAGTLRLDLASGGSLNAATPVSFGLATNYFTANTGTLEIKGASSGSSSTSVGALRMYTNAAAKVVVSASTTLTASSLSRVAYGTLHFDLSAADSSAAFTSAPSMVNGLMKYATVTDASGTTGFVAIDGSNRVTRFIPTEVLKTSANLSTANYKAEGVISLVNSQQTINSLTITGAGAINSAAGSVNTNAILMQEGAGDFAINSTTQVRASTAGGLTIHQYSTDGVLTLEGALVPASGNSVVKTGPGKLLLSGTSNYTGGTYLQGGELQLDGALTSSGSVIVNDGGILSGTGALGASAASSVLIRSGGTIRGGQSGALEITGSLTLEDGAHFAMALGASGSGTLEISGAVTLGNADFALSLESAPLLNQEFTILTGTISGVFGTVNGVELPPEQAFSLNYGGTNYSFQFFYGASDVRLVTTAIPEPGSTVWLALGAAGAALTFRRRKVSPFAS